ncbi:hypothetical protein HDV06_004019 [Boothiomyces sp. JEL0866]|nr:hypothetical protein HDV06_004019 [Boothiomyces sp. JEL0866]
MESEQGRSSEVTLDWRSSIASNPPLKENSRRNKDLHYRFPEISKSELLIDDYLCALKRGAGLAQGRIYMTHRRICFHSSILGITHRVVIYFDDIEVIRRKSTAGFIPNAIEIKCGNQIYHFASFISRDSAFERLVSIWKQSNAESYFSTNSNSTEHIGIDEITVDSVVPPESIAKLKEAESLQVPTLITQSSTLVDVLEDKCTHDTSRGFILSDESFPVNFHLLWDRLFGDCKITQEEFAPLAETVSTETQSFMDWFMQSRRGILNLQKTHWKLKGHDSAVLEFDKARTGYSRTIKFDMSVGIQTIGSVTIDTVVSKTKDSICIKSVTTNTGAPFSNSYYTVLWTCVLRNKNNPNHSNLLTSYSVEFESNTFSMIKMPIQQAIRSRIPEYYHDLIQVLQDSLTPTTSDKVDRPVTVQVVRETQTEERKEYLKTVKENWQLIVIVLLLYTVISMSFEIQRIKNKLGI